MRFSRSKHKRLVYMRSDEKSLPRAARRSLIPVTVALWLGISLSAWSQQMPVVATNALLVVVRGSDKSGVNTNAVQVVVREADKGVRPKEVVEIIVGAATVLTLLYGLYTAYRKFGWSREDRTFLRIELDARVIRKAAALVLVAVTIRLENKGQTRLSARKTQDLPYKDDFDTCDFPGTLKVRPFPDRDLIRVVDWYDLEPMQGMEEALERLNYLDEFQDPSSDFEESDFWLEPNETSESQIAIWLPPGCYALKAFFLGSETEPNEEEYWSVTKYVVLENPIESLA
jgi:hypothetical protein